MKLHHLLTLIVTLAIAILLVGQLLPAMPPRHAEDRDVRTCDEFYYIDARTDVEQVWLDFIFVSGRLLTIHDASLDEALRSVAAESTLTYWRLEGTPIALRDDVPLDGPEGLYVTVTIPRTEAGKRFLQLLGNRLADWRYPVPASREMMERPHWRQQRDVAQEQVWTDIQNLLKRP